jgi:hypothetical protein
MYCILGSDSDDSATQDLLITLKNKHLACSHAMFGPSELIRISDPSKLND